MSGLKKKQKQQLKFIKWNEMEHLSFNAENRNQIDLIDVNILFDPLENIYRPPR